MRLVAAESTCLENAQHYTETFCYVLSFQLQRKQMCAYTRRQQTLHTTRFVNIHRLTKLFRSQCHSFVQYVDLELFSSLLIDEMVYVILFQILVKDTCVELPQVFPSTSFCT